MTTKEIELAIDALFEQISAKENPTHREYNILQRANRIRFSLIENHMLTVKQRIEALLLIKGVLITDVGKKDKLPGVADAVAFVKSNMAFLGNSGLSEYLNAGDQAIGRLVRQYEERA